MTGEPDSKPALADWLGREESATDSIDLLRVEAMQAMLDRNEGLGPGDPLPPLWHWLYFWETAPASGLGVEGHAALGDFLPPVTLPRRMWAGSRIRFPGPLPIGATARRDSRILKVEEKTGRSGQLVFVTVGHRIASDAGLAIEEEHDIVYREAPKPDDPAPAIQPAPSEADWQRVIEPGPVLLFRYSALTFNAHRIHFDRDYCREEEGYPGLVVHGPLMATLMVDLVRRQTPDAGIAAFTFRAKRPVFDTAPFTVAGRAEDGGAALWVADAEGALCMDGRVELA